MSERKLAKDITNMPAEKRINVELDVKHQTMIQKWSESGW